MQICACAHPLALLCPLFGHLPAWQGMCTHAKHDACCSVTSSLLHVHGAEDTATPEIRELVAGARKLHPAMLSQLECVMTEMERITVLPEEHWHSLLQSLQVVTAWLCTLPMRVCMWIM